MAAPADAPESAPVVSKIDIKDVMYKYVPITGGASSVLFSAYIMNPRMIRDVFGTKDALLFNTLWFNAHVGIGLYLYGSNHLQSVKTPYKVTYSVYGSVLFNFGSVLVLATTKRLLPNCGVLRCIIGVASSAAMLAIGHQYLALVNGDKSAESQRK